MRVSFQIDDDGSPARLDLVLAGRFPDHSRNLLASLIREGKVFVDGRACKPKSKITGGETIELDLPDPDASPIQAQAIPLSVIHQDESILVIDKPAGMSAHPVGGRGEGTLVNALAGAFQRLPGEPSRPGLVHRLDKDTSGVLVVALTSRALASLSRQFHDRTVEKEYLALVLGEPAEDEGVVALPLGRKPGDRTRQAVRFSGGRPAESRFRVLERFGTHALLAVKPKTGRTHQIRVHLAALGHPILADKEYGGGGEVFASALGGRRPGSGEAPVLARHFLHARRLAFEHPVSGERLGFESPLPPDLQATLDALRNRGA